nr:hypothetical protein [Tanacetum cinerariifolium]
SPEISPSDRHDFQTVASLHIKEGFDRWDLDFEGHEGRFSVHIHASREKPVHSTILVITFLTVRLAVASKCTMQVDWGKISMVDAEKRNALKDLDNRHFVLLSDSFEDPGPHGSGRYSEHMLPEVEKKFFRKGRNMKNLQERNESFTICAFPTRFDSKILTSFQSVARGTIEKEDNNDIWYSVKRSSEKFKRGFRLLQNAMID